jgi:hypothetical protein
MPCPRSQVRQARLNSASPPSASTPTRTRAPAPTPCACHELAPDDSPKLSSPQPNPESARWSRPRLKPEWKLPNPPMNRCSYSLSLSRQPEPPPYLSSPPRSSSLNLILSPMPFCRRCRRLNLRNRHHPPASAEVRSKASTNVHPCGEPLAPRRPRRDSLLRLSGGANLRDMIAWKRGRHQLGSLKQSMLPDTYRLE